MGRGSTWAEEAAPNSMDLPVIEKTLKNGLKVLIVEKPGVPVVSFSYMVPVGAQDAPKGKTGLPHMLEHMMFKGTETIGTKDYAKEKVILDTMDQIALEMNAEKAKLQPSMDRLKELAAKMKKLEDDDRQVVVKDELSAIYTRNGGQSLNAWTSQDVTNYHITLPANKVLLYCTVEKDRLAHPVFREFYSERNVVAQERRWRTESSPQGALYEALESTAFQASPYKDPTIGWMSDIMKLTRPDAMAFYRQCYRPDHGVLAVVGGVKAKEILPILESTLGTVPNPKVPPQKKEWTVEPPQKGPRNVVARFDADPVAVMAWHVPNFPHQESVVLDVLSTILTSGNNSRLQRDLIYKAQVLTSVSSETGFPGDRDPNLFLIEFTPAPLISADKIHGSMSHLEAQMALMFSDHKEVTDKAAMSICQSLILSELVDIQKNGVTLEELEKARRTAESSFLWGKTSAEGLAQDLAYNQAVHGDWRYLTRYLEMVRSVTSKDIQNVVAQYLTEDNRTIATLERPAK